MSIYMIFLFLTHHPYYKKHRLNHVFHLLYVAEPMPFPHLLRKNIFPRACLKIAFCEMCVTVCRKFVPKSGGVAGYAD